MKKPKIFIAMLFCMFLATLKTYAAEMAVFENFKCQSHEQVIDLQDASDFAFIDYLTDSDVGKTGCNFIRMETSTYFSDCFKTLEFERCFALSSQDMEIPKPITIQLLYGTSCSKFYKSKLNFQHKKHNSNEQKFMYASRRVSSW